MKALRVFKNAHSIISDKKEGYFAYLFANSFEELGHLTKVKRFQGVGTRFLVFIYNVFSRFRLSNTGNQITGAKYFFFAGSQNQLNALLSTYSEVTKENKALMMLDGECKKSNKGRYAELTLSPSMVFIVISLTIVLLPSLLYRAFGTSAAKPFRFYLDAYLACYFYVPYFYDLLERSSCKTVLISNDHSPPNRSLMAVCQRLDIKIVYMQHASVSPLFPPLEFDYVFLDGVVALDIYREIADRAPENIDKFNQCSIFLNGQKKAVPNFITKSQHATVCGIGFSHLDPVDFILKTTKLLASFFEHTVVRLHPSHLKSGADSIESAILAFERNVTLSKGRQEPIASFIEAIDVFFGTETSLHLEVAVAGRRCFRIGYRGEDVSDYYGYLKRGLCSRVDLEDLDEWAIEPIEQIPSERDAVRAFSSSYGTQWFSREGLLNSKTLEALNSASCHSGLLIALGYKRADLDQNIWELSP